MDNTQMRLRHELAEHKQLVRAVSLPDVANLHMTVVLFDLLLAARAQVRREMMSFNTPTAVLENQLVGDGRHVQAPRQIEYAVRHVERPRPARRPRSRVPKIMVIASRVLRQRAMDYFARREGSVDRRRVRLNFGRIRVAHLEAYNGLNWLNNTNDDDDDEENDGPEPEHVGSRPIRQCAEQLNYLLLQSRLNQWNPYLNSLFNICLEGLVGGVCQELFHFIIN